VDRGIRFIQLREKNFSDRDILIACEEIQTVIDGSNTKLIMNDRADLASLRDADGLHLGQDDLPLELAARFFNREGHIWGLSTHSVEQARVAWYHNPDYIGFGPLFSTPTKKNPDPVVGLDCLGALVKESPMPVVAIGGKFMTQMQYAQKGEITTAMEEAARFENCSPEIIREGLAEGTIVIPRNRDRHFPARAIGKGMKTKVNVNMGTSEYHCSFSEEREKLQTALDLEADSIMDLSTGPDARILLEQIINQSTVMVGTVPIHQAELGVDFMTLHCGINRKSLPFINEEDRTAGIVSRGGITDSPVDAG